jgi:hypothetical protein
MRTLMFCPVAAAVVALASLSGSGAAAPALPDKPVKWEYAELISRSTAGRKTVAPAAEDAPPQPALPAVRFVTAEEEIPAANWEELAEKLKAAPAKKGSTVNAHRLRVLNHLGAEGWELVSGTGSGPGFGVNSTLLFKRRVP